MAYKTAGCWYRMFPYYCKSLYIASDISVETEGLEKMLIYGTSFSFICIGNVDNVFHQ